MKRPTLVVRRRLRPTGHRSRLRISWQARQREHRNATDTYPIGMLCMAVRERVRGWTKVLRPRVSSHDGLAHVSVQS
jgi:hypothetical protein